MRFFAGIACLAFASQTVGARVPVPEIRKLDLIQRDEIDRRIVCIEDDYLLSLRMFIDDAYPSCSAFLGIPETTTTSTVPSRTTTVVILLTTYATIDRVTTVPTATVTVTEVESVMSASPSPTLFRRDNGITPAASLFSLCSITGLNATLISHVSSACSCLFITEAVNVVTVTSASIRTENGIDYREITVTNTITEGVTTTTLTVSPTLLPTNSTASPGSGTSVPVSTTPTVSTSSTGPIGSPTFNTGAQSGSIPGSPSSSASTPASSSSASSSPVSSTNGFPSYSFTFPPFSQSGSIISSSDISSPTIPTAPSSQPLSKPPAINSTSVKATGSSFTSITSATSSLPSSSAATTPPGPPFNSGSRSNYPETPTSTPIKTGNSTVLPSSTIGNFTVAPSATGGNSTTLPSSTLIVGPPTSTDCPADNGTIYSTFGQNFLIECYINYGGPVDQGLIERTLYGCVDDCAIANVGFSETRCYASSYFPNIVGPNCFFKTQKSSLTPFHNEMTISALLLNPLNVSSNSSTSVPPYHSANSTGIPVATGSSTSTPASASTTGNLTSIQTTIPTAPSASLTKSSNATSSPYIAPLGSSTATSPYTSDRPPTSKNVTSGPTGTAPYSYSSGTVPRATTTQPYSSGFSSSNHTTATPPSFSLSLPTQNRTGDLPSSSSSCPASVCTSYVYSTSVIFSTSVVWATVSEPWI